MDKAKKRLASAFDGLRNNLQASSAKLENLAIAETLSYRDFNLAKVGDFMGFVILRFPDRAPRFPA